MTLDLLWEWVKIALAVVTGTAAGLIGLVFAMVAVREMYHLATGRRTAAGRRILSLTAETRAATRQALDEDGEMTKIQPVIFHGKRAHAEIMRDIWSPLTTPMAREIASWHGLRPIHRSMDVRIGTYPVYFHDPARGFRS